MFLFFEESWFDYFISYLLGVWFSDDCGVGVGLVDEINFSEDGWLFFLYRFRIDFH